ncbi:peptidase family C78-domain-containing protein [Collybia nuda]|uniref:Peptidase family C78-domain-containing protein n=1 Tax=Collybia nuda TaxID=64659 RepID=A0A9P5XS57_9AGAR|nr:peptidase family C78-domain-containing protein [Collybia nuda]
MISHLIQNSIASNPEHEQLLCGICSQNLEDLVIYEREKHYEKHFLSDYQEFTRLTSFRKWSRNLNQYPRNDSDTFWHASQFAPPPSNFTPGVINLLKKSLQTSYIQGSTRRAALCYERSVHISREHWDIGWGCGYRNFLIACAALMDQPLQPLYFPLLGTPIGPGIRNLQSWIEDAWKDGFDHHGAQELKNLVGTHKWVGTSDLWVAFTFRGIPAELVDFDLKYSTGAVHVTFLGCAGFEVVTNWIIDYFTPKSPHSNLTVNESLCGASPIVVTNKMPIILQHNGHSRTIVGYEMTNKGHLKLLTFDPAHVLDKNTRKMALSSSNFLSESHHPPLSTTQQPQKQRSSSFSSNSIPPTATKRSQYNGPANTGNISDTPAHPRHKLDGSRSDHDMRDVMSNMSLNRFRLDARKFGKKQYQILYFPMTAPLTTQERMQRKDVVSTKFC